MAKNVLTEQFTEALNNASTAKIDIHACNVCLDCTKVCNRHAIAYRPNSGVVRQTSPESAQAG